MVRKRWKRKRRNRRRKRWREMVIMSALGMKISRMYKGLLHIMVLAINTRFIRSAMERGEQAMLGTAEKSCLKKTCMFTVLVKTPKMTKGYVVIWIKR